MFWIVLTVIFAILIAGGFMFWWWGRKQNKIAAEKPKDTNRYSSSSSDEVPAFIGLIVAIVCLVLWLGLTAFASLHMIGQREVGVVSTFGSIVGQVGPGMQTTAPWQSVQKQSTAIEKYRVENHEGFSSETQPVFYTATLNWHVEPDAVQNLYKTVGPNFFDRIIPARVDQAFKSETVKYTAIDIAPNREKIKENVLNELKRTLGVYAISADDLNIDNLSFSAEFQKAITEKQVATQQALAAQNKVKTAQYEAEQQVAAAKGKAEATKIEGEMLRQYPSVIQMRAIEKLNPNVQVMLLPSNSNFILPASVLEQK